MLHELKNKDYEYIYIQTRLHNEIVVHMFESLNFDVIGKNYHSIERQSNLVATFDLKQSRNLSQMTKIAQKLYPGFESI